MTRRLVITMLLALLLGTAMTATTRARTRTTRNNLRATTLPLERIDADTTLADSLPSGVDPAAITLKNFSKRAGDTKESFLVTNNSAHRMSAVRLRLRYTRLNGEIIHERDVTVPVSLKPGETRNVEIRSFDTQRNYYYYAGPKPRKEAVAFRVAFRLLGYDVPIGY